MPFEGVKAVVEVTDEQVRTEGFTASYGPSVITGDLELGRRSGAGVLDLKRAADCRSTRSTVCAAR